VPHPPVIVSTIQFPRQFVKILLAIGVGLGKKWGMKDCIRVRGYVRSYLGSVEGVGSDMGAVIRIEMGGVAA
jgi:hypothetical protein